MHKVIALIIIIVSLDSNLSGQLTFESVALPHDCSIMSLSISPTGEQYVQLHGQWSSIYTSMDGQTWTEEQLNDDYYYPIDFIFYEDGTPILKTDRGPDQLIIRQDNNWLTLNPLNEMVGFATAATLSNDTLYCYQSGGVYSSLNKGETFELHLQLEESKDIKDIIIYKDLILLTEEVGGNSLIKTYQNETLINEVQVSRYERLYTLGNGEVLLTHLFDENYNLY